MKKNKLWTSLCLTLILVTSLGGPILASATEVNVQEMKPATVQTAEETTTESSEIVPSKPVDSTETIVVAPPVTQPVAPPVTGTQEQPTQPATPESQPVVTTPETNNPAVPEEVVIDNQPIVYVKNQTTEEFIESIAEEAREIAGENDLYASVMIAQAILETGSGGSALAQEPNFNLYGIKGSYEGSSVSFNTAEDNGSGEMYTIVASFRKYPSYKESLTDYAELLTKGISGNDDFYNGTWKTNAATYQEATAFLTGKYATDTRYDQKLNGLIETYDLTQYDEGEKAQEITHSIQPGETLGLIAEKYETTVAAIMEKNHLDSTLILAGQDLTIKK